MDSGSFRLFRYLAFLLPQRRLGWSDLLDLDHHHVSCCKNWRVTEVVSQKNPSEGPSTAGCDISPLMVEKHNVRTVKSCRLVRCLKRWLNRKMGKSMVSKAWGGWWMNMTAVTVTKELPLTLFQHKGFGTPPTPNWNPVTPELNWSVCFWLLFRGSCGSIMRCADCEIILG